MGRKRPAREALESIAKFLILVALFYGAVWIAVKFTPLNSW